MYSEAEPYSESVAAAKDLTSPHFDDEQTLLSAKPVVPLDEVSKTPVNRRVLSGVAVGVIAVVLFALALIGLERKGNNNGTISSSADATSPDSNPSASALPGGSVEANGGASTPDSGSVKNPRVDVPVRNRTPFENKVSRRASASIPVPPAALKTGENDDEEYDLDRRMRRQSRREARRLERRAERDRAAGRDGLFRITDIFEGPRRP